MSMLATMGLSRLFAPAPKMETRRREIKKSTTATMRALCDLGESIASGVHVLYGSVRLYLCVTMQPKPEALAAQRKEDKRQAAGLFEVDELWSAAAVNARWARRAYLTDGEGRRLERAMQGALGMTDAGAKEVFFVFNALESYPDVMYLTDGNTRVRVK